ncbi:hypothetical protein AB9E09_35205, partial [Rhizobium leguminosarum]|uniref:hypothetical protein n=1 Tax=Rhizobium leguminosarum TaxID=384 RepID=UPI003F9C4AE6
APEATTGEDCTFFGHWISPFPQEIVSPAADFPTAQSAQLCNFPAATPDPVMSMLRAGASKALDNPAKAQPRTLMATGYE